MSATGETTQAGPVEVPSSFPFIMPVNPLSSVRTRFPLAKSTYLRGNFAGVVRYLLLSHEDAPRAAQVSGCHLASVL